MTVRERPNDVVVLREHELVRWLQRHPVTLSPEQVRHLTTVAAQPAAWQRMPETESVDHAAFDRLRTAIERARRRRQGWAVTIVVAAVAAMPVAFATLPAAMASLLVP